MGNCLSNEKVVCCAEAKLDHSTVVFFGVAFVVIEGLGEVDLRCWNPGGIACTFVIGFGFVQSVFDLVFHGGKSQNWGGELGFRGRECI